MNRVRDCSRFYANRNFGLFIHRFTGSREIHWVIMNVRWWGWWWWVCFLGVSMRGRVHSNLKEEILPTSEGFTSAYTWRGERYFFVWKGQADARADTPLIIRWLFKKKKKKMEKNLRGLNQWWWSRRKKKFFAPLNTVKPTELRALSKLIGKTFLGLLMFFIHVFFFFISIRLSNFFPAISQFFLKYSYFPLFFFFLFLFITVDLPQFFTCPGGPCRFTRKNVRKRLAIQKGQRITTKIMVILSYKKKKSQQL